MPFLAITVAAISKSLGPIGAPDFFRDARILPQIILERKPGYVPFKNTLSS